MQAPSRPNTALVLIGHGSTLNPDSSQPTHTHVDALRATNIFAEVVDCFWKEEPSMREVLRMVESPEVYLVPDFISEGYFTQTVIPRELELTGPITHRNGKTLKYTAPVGSHPRMTDAILHRAQTVAPGIPPAETTLLIVGHGTGLNENSSRAARQRAEEIAQRGVYAHVQATYMEEDPNIKDWATLAVTTPYVVVVPFFIADGLHSYQDIPVLLGIEKEGEPAASQRTVFRNNPYHLRQKTLYYASAIGTEGMIQNVILDQITTFDTLHPTSTTPA